MTNNDNNLSELELTVRSFNNKTRVDASRYRYLITVLGFSHQPSLCWCQFIKPEKVLVIATPESRHFVDQLMRDIPTYHALPSSALQIEENDGVDLSAIYRAILRFMNGRNPGAVLVDATAGKKSMTSVALLAAEMLGLDAAYVDYAEYDQKTRKPIAGSEFGVLLPKPLAELGELEKRDALSRLQRFDFDGASVILERLLTRVDDIGVIRSLLTLSRALKSWDGFMFEDALCHLSAIKENRSAMSDVLPEIRNLLKDLTQNNSPLQSRLELVNFYYSGERNAECGKHDLGVFMMYRVAERFGQICLADLDLDATRLGNAVISDEVRNTYGKMKHELWGSALEGGTEIPAKAGLVDTYLLLHALGHPMFNNPDKVIFFCGEVKNLATLRNTSIYAHGTKPLTKDDYNRFQEFSRKLVGRLAPSLKPYTIEKLGHLMKFAWLPH